MTSDENILRNHYVNFIDAVRSRKPQQLNSEIEEGHISSSLAHPSAYRTLQGIQGRFRSSGQHRRESHEGRSLTFDPQQEQFPQDQEANNT